MIALPTKKRESIANRQNITANTAAAALRFLILFESERAISSERISVVSFAIMVRFTVFARSSVAYQATQIGVICSALANSFGFTFDSEGHVPGWAVNPNSKLTHIACEAYKHLTGTDMIVEPVHAGVECGAFAEKNPHLDMISVGPTLLDVHTPNETCKIEDVKITTELLIEILERIAK